MHEFKKIIERELALGPDLSIINLIDQLIRHASSLGASDIHIDPQEKLVRVRFRVDGVLEDLYTLPKAIHPEIISRIKVLSGLRTDEHNAAQDGRFRSIISDSWSVDIRVSIVPTYHGENTVLRLLSDRAESFTLETLGFSASDQNKILQALIRQNGMILVTGPTGSGKTTTLYTLIKMLNSKDISIITIEDPIEYAVEGVEQIQVNPRTGLSFANGLRSILRQDPNVIMVGEIRDNDAATPLPRLLDMKIESFLVASTVSIAIGQRLVRKICKGCKEKKTLTKEEQKRLAEVLPADMLKNNRGFFYGRGCAACNGTGYRRRLVIAEVLVASENVKKAILRKAPAREIKELAVSEGMSSMLADGLQKALQGETTIEEVLRVTHE